MYSVAIYACNLHVGGGIQVAASFISELSKIDFDGLRLSVYLSSSVDQNVKSVGVKSCQFYSYNVFDVFGASAILSPIVKQLKKHDLVFVVFGPSYLILPGVKIVEGFARGRIIFKDDLFCNKPSFLSKLTTLVRHSIQLWFFRRADELVVEMEHVKRRLVDIGLKPAKRIHVVHNTISSLYLNDSVWACLPKDIDKKAYSVGLVARNYPHKNISILPVVRSILKDEHSIEVDFYVTFNDQEWNDQSEFFRENVYNVGALTVAQCPAFYQAMDAVIFPSLLECFSVTPLEAMVMRKPLFASDRPFVRDICGDYVFYFDPLDPHSVAACIANYIKNISTSDETRLERARQYALGFSNARRRALQYLQIIRECLPSDKAR